VLKLKRLHVRGVGRFVDLQTIDFEALGNFIQVDGNNKNTGGSSGSAKTTLFNAHDYLLGVSDVPATILQSRLTKEGMFVQGDYDWDGKELSIARGKKEGLVITIDGEVKTGSIKLLEEEIDKILAVPRELFRQMFHKRQFSRGFFLSMTPKETYEFLTSCLNLEKEKLKVDGLEKKIKELTDSISSLSQILEVQKQGKRAVEDSLMSLGLGPVKDMHEEVVDALANKMHTSKQNYLLIEGQHGIQLEELVKTRPSYSAVPFIAESFTPVQFDRNVLNQCEEGMKVLGNRMSAAVKAENDRQNFVNLEISNQKTLLADYSKAVADGERARTEAELKAAQIKSIRDSMCPTCEQTWANQKAKDQEAKLLNDVLALKQLITTGAESKQMVEIIKNKIAALVLDATLKKSQEFLDIESAQSRLNRMIFDEKRKEADYSIEQGKCKQEHDMGQRNKSQEHNAAESAKNHAIMAGYVAKEDELRSRHKAELQQTAGQLDIDTRAHMAAIERLRAYNTAKATYDASVARMKVQHDDYAKAVEALDTELSGATGELILAEEAKRAVKSYISRSFDEALDTISEMTTRIIRHIPNMANATVQLEGLRETKEGKVKEEVNAVINMDGDEGIPLKSLSGGEGSALHLAVDLSVIDLIEQRTAKGINIFILDEPFTGMDTVCIEMALEVLKNSNTNKKLIIVDHNPEVKQMVQSRLIVVRDGTTSKVEQG
jgi:hypothetical protein